MGESAHKKWRTSSSIWSGKKAIHRDYGTEKGKNKVFVKRMPNDNENIKYITVKEVRNALEWSKTAGGNDNSSRATLRMPEEGEYLHYTPNDKLKFYFKFGNMKLSGRIIYWSIAPTKACSPYCSMAVSGSEGACAEYCYGIKQSRIYHGTRAVTLSNLQLAKSKNFLKYMKDAIDLVIKARTTKSRPFYPRRDFIMRIHEQGEFGNFKLKAREKHRDNLYVQEWIEIAHYLDNKYNVPCQFYTKNPYVEEQNYKKNWPKSTKIWYSMGGSKKKSQPIIHDWSRPLNRAHVLYLDAKTIKCGGFKNSRGVDVREQFDRHGEVYAYRSTNTFDSKTDIEIILPEDVDSVAPSDRSHICLGSLSKPHPNTKKAKEWYICGYDCNYCFRQPNNTDRMVIFPQK